MDPQVNCFFLDLKPNGIGIGLIGLERNLPRRIVKNRGWVSFSSSDQLEKGRLGKSQVLTHLHISVCTCQSLRKAFFQEAALTRNRWECATRVARSHLARRCCWSFPSLLVTRSDESLTNAEVVKLRYKYHHLLMTR